MQSTVENVCKIGNVSEMLNEQKKHSMPERSFYNLEYNKIILSLRHYAKCDNAGACDK